MAAPEVILEATVRFLRAHEPFARMGARELEALAAEFALGYYAAGSVITEGGGDEPLYLVQRGHVRAVDPASPAAPAILSAGELFPLPGAGGGPLGALRYVAAEDVFCYLLPAAGAARLRATSAPFAEFCARSLASLLRESQGQVQRGFSQRAVDQQTLLQPVREFVRRAPLSCAAATPIRTALARMHEYGVGTIAVVDDVGRPTGIFTLTDLLSRVVLPGVALDSPIAAAMTSAPGTIDEESSAQEAIALMAESRYHQLVVTREGRLSGIISERDLFALQRVSMQLVLETVRGARDVAALGRAAADIGSLTDNLIAQGAASEPLTRTIASLNDALTQRLFVLLLPQFDLAGTDWCWLSLGSEGRREQTVASDQDNALLFDPRGADPATVRPRLLAFAEAANAALAGLGFPLCPGDIMARNPECCLTVDEWRGRFAGWIREPAPAALLAANIFFDLRPLAGELRLAESLQHWLLGLAGGSRLFLRLLAANALEVEPPLGLVRSFRTDDGPAGGTLDLKTHGTRLIVDAARALALAFGIAATNTPARLRLAGRRLGVGERELDAWVEAFNFLQLLRLRAQRGELAGEGNRVDPYALNVLDQRLLKEALAP